MNVESKIFTITFNPQKNNPKKIINAINKAGYDAEESPANPKANENLHACCKKDSKH